jgi:hypothetical protein
MEYEEKKKRSVSTTGISSWGRLRRMMRPRNTALYTLILKKQRNTSAQHTHLYDLLSLPRIAVNCQVEPGSGQVG